MRDDDADDDDDDDWLIPIFDHPLLARRGHARRRSLVPLHARYRRLPRADLVHHLARLPVPEAYKTARVSARDKPAVRADGDIRAVARRIVAPEALFTVLPEPVRGCVYHDLVVPALEGHRLARRVQARRRQRVHVRFRDEFDRHRDVDFPRPQ